MDKFRCKCKCIVEEHEVVLVKAYVAGRYSRRKSCPKHTRYLEGQLLTRIYTCACSRVMEVALSNGRSTRCPECQAAYNLQSAKENQRIIRAKIQEAKKVVKAYSVPEQLENTFNCLNFDLCRLCIKPYFECKMFKPKEK